MFKLFHKKLNKKGFTLAELLVVVAIIAILVAIAIPIFTNATQEAQRRTNEANIRSVKAFAITNILSNWTELDDHEGTARKRLSAGIDSGWFATAKVDAHGNISNLQLYVYSYSAPTDATTYLTWCGVTTQEPTANKEPVDLSTGKEGETGTLAENGHLESVAIPSGGYWVQVYISPDDYKTTT